MKRGNLFLLSQLFSFFIFILLQMIALDYIDFFLIGTLMNFNSEPMKIWKAIFFLLPVIASPDENRESNPFSLTSHCERSEAIFFSHSSHCDPPKAGKQSFVVKPTISTNATCFSFVKDCFEPAKGCLSQ